jgi:hypothetical protein
MRTLRTLSAAALLLAAPSAVRAEPQRIVPVEIVVASDEDDADRARVEGQISDLAVDVRVLRGAAIAQPPAADALRIAFETTDDRSRRVTLTNVATGFSQARRVELPNGPAALSAQRESIALTARRMIKAQIEASPATASARGPAAEGAREGARGPVPWAFGALVGVAGSGTVEGAMLALRGEARGFARRGGLRVDLGVAGVHRAFDADGYRWSVEGLGPVAMVGVERAWASSTLYAGVGAAYVVGVRAADPGAGQRAAPEAGRGFALPRVEVAWRRPLAARVTLGVAVAAELELPRTRYLREGESGPVPIGASPALEPSLALQAAWDTEDP